MKYIQKNQEPEEFSTWKSLENENWQPNWKNFQKPEKDTVHDALLKEQGYICCYCGMRIDERKDSHIEHLKPRADYPNLQLEYTNLLASCQGEESEENRIPVHCGHKKGNWYDENKMVSPLEPDCAEFFRYTGSGEILSTDDPSKQAAAEATIEKLGLNIPKLQDMRSEAIAGILLSIEGLTETEIEHLAKGYEQSDKEGRYRPFYSAIAYFLNAYYPYDE